jgi:phospholipase C
VSGRLQDLFEPLRDDVRRSRLPQVSWIVAPEAFSEHGNWPANYGAWYLSQVLDALTSNPDVWSKTVLFLTYDENDGFFDHMIPPTPPFQGRGRSTVDTSNEIFPGNPGNPRWPYGLGFRVPMIVISPWSKGGWVCSEVFDHTSLIRFIQRRFAQSRPELDRKQHHGVASHDLRRPHRRRSISSGPMPPRPSCRTRRPMSRPIATDIRTTFRARRHSRRYRYRSPGCGTRAACHTS